MLDALIANGWIDGRRFALDDEAVAALYPNAWLGRLARLVSGPGGDWLGALLTSLAQRSEERRHARMRRELLHLEDALADLLAVSGPQE